MYKVVIVDDEWWILQGIKETFRFSEMEFEPVLETTNPNKAFEYIIKNDIDVVLTDIRMPGLSGLELIKKTREKGINAEFVIISGYAEFHYAQEAIREGAFDYCLKPIKETKADEILARLSRHLKDKFRKNNPGNYITKTTDTQIDNQDFKRLVDYIKTHYSDKLYLKTLSHRFGFNENYTCHLFNKYLDSTFSEYLTAIRMEKAIELLTNESLTIQQIADKTGYKDYYYFNKVFKKHYNMTATEYRKNKVRTGRR